MDLSGITEHLASVEDDAALIFPIGGRTYRVRPPSVSIGLRLAALWASQFIEDRGERVKAIADALGEDSVPALALGSDVVAQMDADKVPAPVVAECVKIARVAWALGPEAAQNYVNRSRDGGEASGKAPSRSPRPRKSGKRSGTPSA